MLELTHHEESCRAAVFALDGTRACSTAPGRPWPHGL